MQWQRRLCLSSLSAAAGASRPCGTAPSSANSAVRRRNSSCSNKACRRGRSASAGISSSSDKGNGTCRSSATSFHESRASAQWARMFSRRFFWGIAAALSSTASNEPQSRSNCAAVLGPMPGIPGILSAESPVKASRSWTFCGLSTSQRSHTSCGPYSLLRMVSIIQTRSLTSCIRSLSVETMLTSQPSRCCAAVASVAITSSAS